MLLFDEHRRTSCCPVRFVASHRYYARLRIDDKQILAQQQSVKIASRATERHGRSNEALLLLPWLSCAALLVLVVIADLRVVVLLRRRARRVAWLALLPRCRCCVALFVLLLRRGPLL